MIVYQVKFLNDFFDQKPEISINKDNIAQKHSFKYKYKNISIITYSDFHSFFQRYKNNELTKEYKKKYFTRMATGLARMDVEYIFNLKNLLKFDYVDIRLWMYNPKSHAVFEFVKKLEEGVLLRFFQNTFSECHMDIYINEEYKKTVESVAPMITKYVMGQIDINVIHLITEEYRLDDDFLKKLDFQYFLYEEDEAEKLIIRNELNNINEFYIINSIPRR